MLEDFQYGVPSLSQPVVQDFLNPSKNQDFLKSAVGDVNSGSGFGNLFGEDNIFSQNSDLIGLAGGAFDMFNAGKDRKLKEKVVNFNIQDSKDRLRMTQQDYNNQLFRSNSIEDQMAGGKSRYTGSAGRQYVGPADTQPGYVAPAQGLAAAGTPPKKPRV